MKYREQLKYIKSHQEPEERKYKRKKKKRVGFLDKLLWRILFLISVLFVLIMYYVDFFPIPYMIAAGGILLSILMIIIIMQQIGRAHV